MALSKLVTLFLLAQLHGNFCQFENLTVEECRQIAWDCNLACRNNICPGDVVWTLNEAGVCVVLTNECYFNSRVCNALLMGRKPLKKVTKEECLPYCSVCEDLNLIPICATNGLKFDMFHSDCDITKHSCENGEYWQETAMNDCQEYFGSDSVSYDH